MTKNDNLNLIRIPNLSQVPRNKTTLFMLPSIGFREEKTSLKMLNYFGFVNCYLSHTQSQTGYPDCLVLIFNPTKTPMEKFKDFYQVYRTYPNFVTDYSIDYQLIAIIFKVLPKWHETLKAFIDSHYSGMSKEYSELFKVIDTETGKIHAGPEYFIMRRDSEYRKYLENSLSIRTREYSSIVKITENAELMSPLDLTQENFNYEFVKNQQ